MKINRDLFGISLDLHYLSEVDHDGIIIIPVEPGLVVAQLNGFLCLYACRLKSPPQKVWPPRFNKYIVPILFSVLTPGAGIAAVGAGLDVDVTGIPEPVDSVRLRKILTPGVHPHIIANGDSVRFVLSVV